MPDSTVGGTPGRYPLSPVPTVPWAAEVELDPGSIVNRRPIVDRRGIARIGVGRGGVRRGRLIHIEVNLLRNTILAAEQAPRSEVTRLRKLVGHHRHCLDHVIIR